MYVKSETDTDRVLWLERLLEDISGGGTVAQADFQSDTEEMLGGAPLGVDSDGLYHIFKTAKIETNASDSATSYRVEKGHEFNVGDVIVDSALAGASQTITAIATTETDYDTITVGTTLGHAVTTADCLVQASAEAAAGSAAYKYTLKGLALNTVDLTADNDNLGCGIMVRGTVNESLLPYYLDATLKALSALSFIRFE